MEIKKKKKAVEGKYFEPRTGRVFGDEKEDQKEETKLKEQE